MDCKSRKNKQTYITYLEASIYVQYWFIVNAFKLLNFPIQINCFCRDLSLRHDNEYNNTTYHVKQMVIHFVFHCMVVSNYVRVHSL